MADANENDNGGTSSGLGGWGEPSANGIDFAGPGLSLGGRGVGLAAAGGSGYGLGSGFGSNGLQAGASGLAPGLGDQGGTAAALAGLAVDKSGRSVDALNLAEQNTRATVQLLSQVPIIGPILARGYAAISAGGTLARSGAAARSDLAGIP